MLTLYNAAWICGLPGAASASCSSLYSRRGSRNVAGNRDDDVAVLQPAGVGANVRDDDDDRSYCNIIHFDPFKNNIVHASSRKSNLQTPEAEGTRSISCLGIVFESYDQSTTTWS